jgi:hypothetical protein
MASLLPYQVLNLAAAPSPHSQPSPSANINLHSTRQPAPDDEVDLSAEPPTRAARLTRITVSKLTLAGKVRRFLSGHRRLK